MQTHESCFLSKSFIHWFKAAKSRYLLLANRQIYKNQPKPSLLLSFAAVDYDKTAQKTKKSLIDLLS